MPQLPSGKHIALYPDSLYEILEEAFSGIKVHELMSINKHEDLFKYVEVLYFRIQSEDEEREERYFSFSLVPPEGLMPYSSGYNLITIQEELKNWEYCDQKAFIDFLNSKRTEHFFHEIISMVQQCQEQLLKQPTTLQGMLATWWKLGIHPLQDKIE